MKIRKLYSFYFIAIIVIAAVVMQGCEHPYWPATNKMYVYAPGATFEVGGYSQEGSSEEMHYAYTIALTDEKPTSIISSAIGDYYPQDLKNHPEWSYFTIKRIDGDAPIYCTPYKAVIVNGRTEDIYTNESEHLQDVLDALVAAGYMIKIGDENLHSLPISVVWSDSMAAPIEGHYPQITITFQK